MWIAAAKASQRGRQNNLRYWHWQVSSTKPSANVLTKYRDSICLAGTHSSLQLLLIHHPDKHTFPISAPTQTHPNEMAVWTQISEWKFQKTSKAFFPERSLNKKLQCPCISFLGSSTLWRPHCPYFKPKCKRPANITHGVSEQGRTSYATSFAGMPGWRISLHLSPTCCLVAGVLVICPEANLLVWPHLSWKESAGKLQNPGVHNCNIFLFKWNFPLESVLMALVMTAFFLPEQNRCRNFFLYIRTS